MSVVLVGFKNRGRLLESSGIAYAIENTKEALFSEAGFSAKPTIKARAEYFAKLQAWAILKRGFT